MSTVTTLYVGERSLGAATGRLSGKSVELALVRTVALPADYPGRDVAGRAAALRDALKEAGLDARAAVVVVPRGQAILRSFSLPPSSAEELHRMVGFQLEKDLPLPPEQVRTSYAARPGPDGKAAVGAAAVPLDALARITEPLAAAGVRASGAVVGTHGLSRLLPPGGADAVLVVQVADGAAEVAVLDESGVGLTRTAPADPEELATEVSRALLSSRTPVSRVVVAGEGAEARALAGSLAAALGRDVVTAAPDASVIRRADQELSGAGAVAAGVALALLADRASVPDVLNPPSPRKSMRIGRNARIGILAALVLLALGISARVHLSDLRGKAGAAKSEYEHLKPQADRVAKLRGQLAAANLWQDRRFAWIDVLAALRSGMDRTKLHLVNLSAGDSGWVIAKGKATDDTHVTGWISELQKLSPYFREVVADSITSAADGGPFKHDFSLRIRVDGLGPPPKK